MFSVRTPDLCANPVLIIFPGGFLTVAVAVSAYLSSREPVLLKRYLSSQSTSSTVHKTTFQTFQIVVKVLSWENKRKRCFPLLLLSLLLSAAAALVLLLLLLFFSVPLISRAFGEASDEPEVCSLFPRFFSSRLVC